MKLKIVLPSLTALALLSGCGQEFQPLGSANFGSSTKDSVIQPDTMSSKILDDVGRGLYQSSTASGTPTLTEEQIAALIQSATEGLKTGGISNSTDLRALLPAIIQKLTKGLADLQITGANPQTAELVSSIGKLVLGSVTQMNGSTDLSPELVALITKSLFQNLPTAGVSNGNLSSVAGTLMDSLVAHLGQKGQRLGLPTDLLSSLLQSATSGATNGIGNLDLRNLTNAQVKEILRQIGQGSTQGLSRLSGISSNNALLQALIGAVVNGAKQGLNQGSESRSELKGTISQLLASLIAGQETGLSNSSMSDAKREGLSFFLRLLLSKI